MKIAVFWFIFHWNLLWRSSWRYVKSSIASDNDSRVINWTYEYEGLVNWLMCASFGLNDLMDNESASYYHTISVFIGLVCSPHCDCDIKNERQKTECSDIMSQAYTRKGGGKVVTMPSLSSPVTPQVFIFTSCGAPSDNNVGVMTTLGF